MSANEDGTSSADEYNREAVNRIKKRLKNKKNKYGYRIRLNYKEC